MAEHGSKAADTPLWYTEAELASLLRVHQSTVSRRVRAGSFPLTPLVVGSKRLYAASEVHRLAGLAA
jgi:hypothetical protein